MARPATSGTGAVGPRAHEHDPFFASLKRDFDAARAEVQESFGGSTSGALKALASPAFGSELGRRNAAVYDALLSRLFAEMQARAADAGAWEGVLFAAVGSYGRGAVALRSDIDVRLIA